MMEFSAVPAYNPSHMTTSIERPLPDCLPCFIFRFLRRPLLELLLDERLQWRLAEVTQGRAIDEEARRAIHPQRPHVGDVLPQHLVDGRPIGIRSRLRHVQADVANDVPDQQRLGPVMRGPLRLRSQRPLERLPATRRRGPDDGATTAAPTGSQRRRQRRRGEVLTFAQGTGKDLTRRSETPRSARRPQAKGRLRLVASLAVNGWFEHRIRSCVVSMVRRIPVRANAMRAIHRS